MQYTLTYYIISLFLSVKPNTAVLQILERSLPLLRKQLACRQARPKISFRVKVKLTCLQSPVITKKRFEDCDGNEKC